MLESGRRTGSCSKTMSCPKTWHANMLGGHFLKWPACTRSVTRCQSRDPDGSQATQGKAGRGWAMNFSYPTCIQLRNRCCSALSMTPVRAATLKAPELAQLRNLLHGVQQGAICARNNTACKWSSGKRTLHSALTLRKLQIIPSD